MSSRRRVEKMDDCIETVLRDLLNASQKYRDMHAESPWRQMDAGSQLDDVLRSARVFLQRREMICTDSPSKSAASVDGSAI